MEETEESKTEQTEEVKQAIAALQFSSTGAESNSDSQQQNASAGASSESQKKYIGNDQEAKNHGEANARPSAEVATTSVASSCSNKPATNQLSISESATYSMNTASHSPSARTSRFSEETSKSKDRAGVPPSSALRPSSSASSTQQTHNNNSTRTNASRNDEPARIARGAQAGHQNNEAAEDPAMAIKKIDRVDTVLTFLIRLLFFCLLLSIFKEALND